MTHKQMKMKNKKSNNSKNNKLKLFEKLAIGVGYVWSIGLLGSILFREDIRNWGWHPWDLYVQSVIVIIGFAIILYYIWLDYNKKQ